MPCTESVARLIYVPELAASKCCVGLSSVTRAGVDLENSPDRSRACTGWRPELDAFIASAIDAMVAVEGDGERQRVRSRLADALAQAFPPACLGPG